MRPPPIGQARSDARLRVAYVLSRFPKLTETFILYEILEMRRQGVEVAVHALVREPAEQAHPEARRLMPEVVFVHGARAVAWAQLTWLRRRPLVYLGLWLQALTGNLRSPRFLIRALATIPMASYLAHRMEQAGTDHVHAHWATHSALAAMAAARLLGVSYSFTAHAHDLYVNRSMLKRKVKGASFVATISDYNRALLDSWFPTESDEKTVVVRCGVDLAELVPARREMDPSAPLEVVCVASLQPQKGHRVLVEAIGLLYAKGVPVHCVLVGDGPESDSLRGLVADLHLETVVELAGALTRPYVIARLQGADVMALASVPLPSGKMEGIPVALMEGMAMELPVVATAISGVPELVTDEVSGYLVPANDADAIAAALERINADRARAREMGVAGRQRVNEAFELRANVALLRARFVEAISRRK
jgi:glycosyltransferase involved in cell wall biosynthesis